MKRLLPSFFLLIALLSALSCSGPSEAPVDLLDEAELAFEHGQFRQAQLLADSIIGDSRIEKLDVGNLCRLSLLFVRLGERSDEEANIVNAAKALDAAALRDNDSTATFIRELPVDDQARFVLVEAVSEGSKHILSLDSLFAEPDSLFH